MSNVEENNNSSLTTDLHVEATYRLTEALVDAENRMRRRVELLREIVFETAVDGRLVFLNKAWDQNLGYDHAACIGHFLGEYAIDEDRPLLEQVLKADSHKLPTIPTQVRFVRSDGSLCWMEASAATLPGGGVVGALHDVTRQKQSQAELAKLSLVASFTDNLVVITDRNGLIEWVNDAFTKRTGYTISEAAGRKPGALLQGPETDQHVVAQIRQWLGEGRSFHAELLNYTKSGEPYWVSFHVTPIRNQNGDIERFISVQTDSTVLRQTQIELEAAKIKAETANIAKTNFLATVSHEMRTPLNVILGYADLVLEDGPASENDANYLKPIRDNAEILLRLISDLLDISKIEAAQIDIETIPFRLSNCFQQALAPIGEKAKQKKLEFSFKYDKLLPEHVVGDPDRLRQIVTNLAENAVKFTDTGSVQVHISGHPLSTREKPVLEIRVVDTGIGISPEAQSRIFERFEQGDSTTTRRKGGAGLGLNIAKSLVEAMGGSISVRSTLGQGAEFYVQLPIMAATDNSTSSSDATQVPISVHSCKESTSVKLLVAEDTDANFSLLNLYLSKAGFLVERATNGRTAVEAAGRSRFDLILMDVEMPEMDGLEATRRIRQQEASQGVSPVPLVALTAHATKGYRELCLEAGCTGYLSKPIRKQVLLDTIDNILEQSNRESLPAEMNVELNYPAPGPPLDSEFSELLPGFLEHCRGEVTRLLGAVEEGDFTLAARIGHDLKGCAPALGFDDLGTLGREIEIHAKEGNGGALARDAETLSSHLSLIQLDPKAYPRY